MNEPGQAGVVPAALDESGTVLGTVTYVPGPGPSLSEIEREGRPTPLRVDRVPSGTHPGLVLRSRRMAVGLPPPVLTGHNSSIVPVAGSGTGTGGTGG